MIRVISVIRVPLMRSLLRTPVAGPYTQLITGLGWVVLVPPALEHDSRAKLDTARLVYVEAKRRDAEVPERIDRIVKVDVIEIDALRAVAAAVEQIEELSANLEVRGLVDAGLLHDAQVFIVEGLRAQVVESRRGIAEEPRRVGIVGAVFRAADGRRRPAEVGRARERIRIDVAETRRADRADVGRERAPGQVGTQIAAVTGEVQKLPLRPPDQWNQRHVAAVTMNSVDLEAADEPVDEPAAIQESLAFAEGHFKDVIEDQRVREVVRRDRPQRPAVKRVLEYAVDRRIAEEVFARVGDQFRKRV